jgi:type I restriction enzyme M protein
LNASKQVPSFLCLPRYLIFNPVRIEDAIALKPEEEARKKIDAMVKVVNPEPGKTINDPAYGTGGFIIAAHNYISNPKNFQLDVEQKRFLRNGTFSGKDIVDSVARLCAMNLFLHGIGGDTSPIEVGDSLISDPGTRYDFVLTNPPFGKKSSVTLTNGDGKADKEALTYELQDFWATTSNKQLNFLQHVKTLLKINGKTAIVVPDNVLFEGGAGETVRRKILHECDVHTLLRLPTGIFYAQGVKANVLFFDRKPASETHKPTNSGYTTYAQTNTLRLKQALWHTRTLKTL